MHAKNLNQLSHKAPHYTIALVGIIATLCFAFSVAMERDLARTSEVFLILSIAFSAKCIYRQNNKADNYLYFLAFVFLIFMSLINGWAEGYYPDDELNHDRFMRHYIRLFLFLAVGWWICRSEKLVVLVFICLTLGFLVKVAGSEDALNLKGILSGRRMNFDFGNAQHTGIYAGSIIFITLFLQVKALKTSKTLTKICLQTLLFSTLIICLICAIASQTRGIFIGLAITLPLLFIAWTIHSSIARKLGIKKALATCIILTVCSIVLAFQHGAIDKRFYSATKTVLTLAEKGINSTPTTSSGIRLHQWYLATQLIMERPFLGHGGGTKERLIKNSKMPKAAIGNFGHFHNSYLELGVAYGLGATAIFLFLLCFLFCRIISALKSQQLSPGLAYIGLSWLIFFSIANIFESYVMYRSGYTLFSIIGGALYGLSIPKRKQHAEPISQNS